MLGKAEAFLIAVRRALHSPIVDYTKIFLKMMGIPALGPKLNSWEYLRSFEQKFSVVQNVRCCSHITSVLNLNILSPQSIETLLAAVTETRTSTKFHKLLEVKLSLTHRLSHS